MKVKTQPRAFVIGAYIPNGGTLMAYHLGQILQAGFGYQAVAVIVGGEIRENGIHRYDTEFQSVTIAEMETLITDRDVLICNPSFSSLMFGLRLPGTKICYAQGFSTFALLDCRFDHYVAVSSFVSKVLSTVYDLQTRVIPAFVGAAGWPDVVPWKERPAGSIYIHLKGDPAFVAPLFDRLRTILLDRAPEILLKANERDRLVPQPDLLREIAGHRYFLTLSVAEGFGLVPLEAMALGTTVVGFDGFGGREYMRPGINCAVARYPDIEAVADKLIAVIRSPEDAERLAANGRATAAVYTYDAFAAAWTQEFTRCLPDRSQVCRAEAPPAWAQDKDMRGHSSS
jgi:hypothetical protein